MNKKILFIAYFYPPLGGPGVQRPLKTIKYLKRHGYYVDVLTVSDIQFHSYDYDLLAESEADNIYRTKSLDLNSILRKKKLKENNNNIYFNTPEKVKKIIRGVFPIDDKIGWIPYAYHEALKLIKRNTYDCIIATIGPLTSGMIAHKLHQKTNLPYYIDYRDHLSTHVYSRYYFKFLRKHAENFERKMQRCAKGIFMVGNFMKANMIKHFGSYLMDKTKVIYNGFDEEDFLEQFSVEPSDFIYIRYVGNIYGNQSLKFFMQAIEQMKLNNEIPDNVKFEFVGNFYLETQTILKTEVLKPHINVIPQQTHKEAVRLTRTANLLLLFLATKDQEDIIPGKLFEYIRSGKPILAMVPTEGEVAQILSELGHKYICKMEDVQQIRMLLNQFLTQNNNQEFETGMAYSRENQTKVMIDTIDKDLS